MAKKDNKEMVQLALDEHKWINTPVVYTTFGTNFSRLQQDVMLMVSGRLQDHLKKFLDEGRFKNPEKPKSMFSSDELVKGIDPVRIFLNELGIANSNYSDVDKALNSLRELWVKAPVFNKESGLKTGENWFPIFKKIFIPESFSTVTGDEYRYNIVSDKQPSRRVGYIDVTINDEIAAYVFDMSKGYFNHLERIAFFCKSAYTSRLYLMLMAHVSNGKMNPIIPYMELKENLGMIEREPKSTIIKSIKYDKFSQLRKQVLDVAKKDMERLADENKSEIVFEYDALYRGSVKRGNPDAIKFTVKRTELGLAREIEVHRPSSQKKLIKYILKQYPTLNYDSLSSIVTSVPDEMWESFKKYVYKELTKVVERPHRWDGTNESFIAFILKEFIKNWKNSINKVKDIQPDLFAQTPVSVVGQEKRKSSIPIELQEVLGEYAEQWKTFIEKYDGPIKPLLLKATHKGSSRGFMWIEFLDKQSVDDFNNAESDPKTKKAFEEMMKLFREIMGGLQHGRIIVRGFRK